MRSIVFCNASMSLPRKSTTISILTLLLFALPLLAQRHIQQFQGHETAANEVLLKLQVSDASSVANLQQTGDVDQVETVGSAGVLRFHSRSKNVETLIREFSQKPNVAFVEPNYIVHATAIPNDPSFGSLWGLLNTGQVINGVAGTPGADISATLAWDISTGSRSNVAAVVDTGIDYRHFDLAANVWSAPAAFTVTIGGTPITCAAGSHGFNAITRVCDPLDDNDHGTHTSGTIGAVGNNGIGVVGVNWTASIMASKFLDATGSGSTADAIDAIDFVIQAKAAFGGATGTANVRVLSNSWGGGAFSQALLDEINKANANDMLFVAAAGNDGLNNDVTPHFPSSYNAPNIVAVAATDNSDALAIFSNFGPTSVHLGAPGVDVLSTVRNNGFAFLSGTSMATPHFSGAALLVLSKCALSTGNLKTLILNNTDAEPALSGITTTGGRLNVNKAIRACALPATPGFSVSASPASATVTQGSSASYTATATPAGGFSGTVSWSVTGLPGGASATFNPSSVSISGTTAASSTMTVTTTSTTATGTFSLTLTGTSGTLSHTATVTLVVNATCTDSCQN